MPDPNTILANTLYDELVLGSGITIPTVDPNAIHLDQPDPTGELYTTVSALTEVDLTTRVVDGTGMFDGMMATVSAHLKQEFDKGRISGKDYADVYLGSMQSAMSTALQFLLTKDQSHLQSLLLQRQARVAEIQAVSERANIDLAKSRLAIAMGETKVMEAAFAKSKLDLAVTSNQIKDLDAGVNIKLYQLSDLLPSQKAGQDATTAGTTAQKDHTLYQTANILPAQKAGITEDTAMKTYQLGNTLPAQFAGLTADNVGKVYTNDFILPAQLTSVREQTEAHRAKTLDTRSDLAPVSGQMGVQKALQEEQIVSYRRDAETKVAKMIIDTWITQKSMDEGLIPPTELQDAAINSAMTALRTNLSL